MPLPEEIVRGLPDAVINELAIYEDRAIRAEQALAVKTEQVAGMQRELHKARDEVDAMAALANELKTAAADLATTAQVEMVSIEEQLRRLLVLQAS